MEFLVCGVTRSLVSGGLRNAAPPTVAAELDVSRHRPAVPGDPPGKHGRGWGWGYRSLLIDQFLCPLDLLPKSGCSHSVSRCHTLQILLPQTEINGGLVSIRYGETMTKDPFQATHYIQKAKSSPHKGWTLHQDGINY